MNWANSKIDLTHNPLCLKPKTQVKYILSYDFNAGFKVLKENLEKAYGPEQGEMTQVRHAL